LIPHVTRHHALWVVAGLLAALLAGRAALAGAADQVFQKGAEKPLVVYITSETYDEIKTTGGGPSFNPMGIDHIVYGDRPQAFHEGEEMRKQGRYEEAIRYYEAALRTPPTMTRHELLDPACYYSIALCLLEDGSDLAAAEAKFKELLEKSPKTRLYPDALFGLGRVMVRAKKYDAAVAQFEKLIKIAVEKSWEEWTYQGYLGKAQALLELEKYKDALAAANKTADARYTDIRIQGESIKAQIYVRQGEYAQAAKLLRELVDKLAPEVAREIERNTGSRMQRTEAQCYNALGHCYLKQGTKNKSDKNKSDDDIREAALSFLWTVVLHQRQPAEHAEALFYAAECFTKLKDNSRATELRNELTEKYPDSPYSRQIRPATEAPAKKESAK